MKEVVSLYQDYAILNVSHRLTVIQQKIWYFLLVFVSRKIGSSLEHKVSIARIIKHLGLKSLNDFESKLLKMHKSYFNQDVFSYYFDDIKIVGGSIYFTYPSHLQMLLAHPCVWDISERLVQVNFKSKYSFFLYEFCLYHRFFECDNVIPLREFRKFMGLSTRQYVSPKSLHNCIILRSLYEINMLTPLNISVKYEKEGKTVIGLKFFIAEKKDLLEGAKEKVNLKRDRYTLFLQNVAYSRYHRLSVNVKEKIDQKYDNWVKTNKEKNISNRFGKIDFLIEECTASYERNLTLSA